MRSPTSDCLRPTMYKERLGSFLLRKPHQKQSGRQDGLSRSTINWLKRTRRWQPTNFFSIGIGRRRKERSDAHLNLIQTLQIATTYTPTILMSRDDWTKPCQR